MIFNQKSEFHWFVVDDVVMGGMSYGRVERTKDNILQFSGTISLENNGGFSSTRMRFGEVNVENHKYFELRLKGDRKKYQFRVKTQASQRYSYTKEFLTNGEWQTIRIPFEEMKATFRGMDLDLPTFPGIQIEEVAFLIGNKKKENFKLLVERIEVK